MKQVINTENIPIKLWLDDMEPEALVQAQHLANLPFAYKHIPIMPDSHVGFGMPIGAILAVENVVIPNAVGVDIGCGMCALKTNIKNLNKGNLKKIIGEAMKLIPVGYKHHDRPQDDDLMPEAEVGKLPIVSQQYDAALKQLGTLGGGNHFIEIQKGSDGYIWIMIHSGSRNLGLKVANHYNAMARRMNEEMKTGISPKVDLAFFPLDFVEAQNYLAEMNYCIDFALANRRKMMQTMVDAMTEVMGAFGFDDMINKSHNFAAYEEHYGQTVMVHRKGATRAYKDELGMIPGSQGTKSYIVRGLGNEESFMSCSHGAGRKMSRRQAQNKLDLSHEISILEKQGILHGIRQRKHLDEAAGAYKDINIVMENQKDLVDVVVELQPLAVMKG